MRATSAFLLIVWFLRGICCEATETLTASALKQLTFEQKLGNRVSLELLFRDEAGRSVTLKECLSDKPAILVLGYYQCPMLCNLVLNGLVESLQEIQPSADSGVQLIFASVDPRETPQLARAKKDSYLKRFGRPGTGQRWHFLCGSEREVRHLAKEVGFNYQYDPVHHEFAHPSGIVILTPDGMISRYFFGVKYLAADLQGALTRASRKQVSSPVQALLILCSRFVPLTGKFSGLIMIAVRLLAIVTVLGIIGIVLFSRASAPRRPKSERAITG